MIKFFLRKTNCDPYMFQEGRKEGKRREEGVGERQRREKENRKKGHEKFEGNLIKRQLCKLETVVKKFCSLKL